MVQNSDTIYIEEPDYHDGILNKIQKHFLLIIVWSLFVPYIVLDIIMKYVYNSPELLSYSSVFPMLGIVILCTYIYTDNRYHDNKLVPFFRFLDVFRGYYRGAFVTEDSVGVFRCYNDDDTLSVYSQSKIDNIERIETSDGILGNKLIYLYLEGDDSYILINTSEPESIKKSITTTKI